MNRKCFLILILIICAMPVFSGDVADYVNLGFSDDSGYFMFGLYGIDYRNSKPYAEIYTVDVSGNRFAGNGVYEKVYDSVLQPGQDGSGALLTCLKKNTIHSGNSGSIT